MTIFQVRENFKLALMLLFYLFFCVISNYVMLSHLKSKLTLNKQYTDHNPNQAPIERQ